MESRKEEETKKLIKAARTGSMKRVADALDHGADINHIPDGYHATALLYAAANGKLRVVIMLLEKGAKFDSISKSFAWNALHAASSRGYSDIVAVLATRIDVNSLTNEGCTSINLAANEGHTAVVTQLLKRGANSKQANKFNFTPLFIATEKGHDECVEILVNDLITRHKDNPQELLHYLKTNDELIRCLKNAKNTASHLSLLKLVDFTLTHAARPYRNPFDDVMEAQAVPVAVALSPQASVFFPPQQRTHQSTQQKKPEGAGVQSGLK